MKNWYYQLKNRALVHIILIILNIISFFLIGTIETDSIIDILVILWLVTGILEIVFVVFEVQLRKRKDKPSTPKDTVNKNSNTIVTAGPQTATSTNAATEVQQISLLESEKNFNTCTEYNGIKYVLKYVYRENLCFVENIDKIKLEDNNITYHLESDNEYDPNTIAVYVGDIRIGLMFKGSCRDIIVRCIKNKRFEVSGFVCKLDIEKNQIAIKVGFFTPLENRKSFTTSIIKTSKKDVFENKRQDNVDCLSEGDIVYFSEDFDSAGLLVTDQYGNELGEISESAREKISGDTIYFEKIIGIVEEISYTDSGKSKAKIRIYLTEEK